MLLVLWLQYMVRTWQIRKISITLKLFFLSGKDPSTLFSVTGKQESHVTESFISSSFIFLLHCHYSRLGDEGILAESWIKSTCHHLRGLRRISSA